MISIKTSLLVFLSSISLFAKSHEEERVFQLKKRLVKEQVALEEKIALIDKLKRQIYHAELALIEVKIESMEKRLANHEELPLSYKKESSSFFLEERKKLTNILDTDATDQKARGLLDRILRMITSINRNIDKSL